MSASAVHSRALRLLHWLNVPFLILMIWSGILIYWANDIYAPILFPKGFYKFFGIPKRLAEGLSIHFLVGWLFVLNGLIYLTWLFCSGHWRQVLPLKWSSPYNILQRIAYTGVIASAAAAVVSGFAIYKPVQLSWLASLLGGYEGARMVHFAAMMSFCIFIPVHVIQVIRAGLDTFRTMVGSRRGYALLALGIVVFVAGWKIMQAQPDIDGRPKPFRQVLELNGKIWKALFRASHAPRSSTPPKGKVPRVNGLIGLQENIDIATWKMDVDTDTEDPNSRKFSVTMDELKKLPRTDQAVRFHCIEGWSEDMTFAGVKFSDFVKAYNIEGKRYVGLASVNEEYYVSIDIESMMHPQTLLAFEMNGEALQALNGAPLRLAIPVKYGIKNLKQIGRIYFSDSRPPDYWAERGYDWYAGL